MPQVVVLTLFNCWSFLKFSQVLYFITFPDLFVILNMGNTQGELSPLIQFTEQTQKLHVSSCD